MSTRIANSRNTSAMNQARETNGLSKHCVVALCVALTIGASSPCRAATVIGVVGDWGTASLGTTNVANMITNTNWDTDYILTVGDNNYGQIDVGHSDWENRVGARYGKFIQQRSGPTANAYPLQTSATQRFFPSLGNHDASPTGTGQNDGNGGLNPGYVDYFHIDPDDPVGRLPTGVHENTQSFYDVQLPIDGGTGLVHLFAMDSNSFQVSADSRDAQQSWLQEGLEKSTATWKGEFTDVSSRQRNTSNGRKSLFPYRANLNGCGGYPLQPERSFPVAVSRLL